MATQPFRWGILGPGAIAHNFVQSLAFLPGASVTAVGSRDKARADTFADKYDIAHRHGSYEELAANPDVDAIYVATPHPLHAEHSILALRGGKHVLCEKPVTVNVPQLESILAVQRETGKFFLEAHWTRFLPAIRKADELVQAGAIGEVRMVQADFGFRTNVNPEGRLFNPALGGGALLDVGCYTVSFAQMLLGDPDSVVSQATLGETGVDEQATLALHYPSGALASLSTAIRTNTSYTSYVWGTTGRITIPSCWGAKSLTLTANGKDETFDLPYEGGGKQFQAEALMQGVANGETESPVLTHAASLSIMRTMDTARSQWGLRYPFESEKP